MDKGAIYIVATPIGNLKDITLRALEVLKSADLILCEDTRVTAKLLNHYQINKPMMSYHQHSDFKKTGEIIDLLKKGKKIALVCDAGTPGISDPGGKLIEEVIASNVAGVIPIPGASALTAGISVAGISMDKFVFMGFPPIKNKRAKYFEKIRDFEYPVVIYESSHRILKTLGDILDNPDLIVFKEMTKTFETIYRGKANDIIKEVKDPKGEFTIIIKKNHERQ